MTCRWVTWLASCLFITLVNANGEEAEFPLHLATARYTPQNGDWHFDDQVLDQENGVATATFNDTLLVSGWGVLDVWTNNRFSSKLQAFGAGFLEGRLTAKHIYTTFVNLNSSTFPASKPGVRAAAQQFLEEQHRWTKSKVSRNAHDPFWNHVGFVAKQLEGLEAGYNTAVKLGIVPPLDTFAFIMINTIGDLFDIIPALNPSERVNWLNLTAEAAHRLHIESGHCSALIKLPPSFEDLFVSHSSWFLFQNTNRIFKHYDLNYNEPSTAARGVSFSSYPGFLSSLDDFYLMDSGLLMTQTTNSVVDSSVYEGSIKPSSLLAWQRVRAACSMSSNGADFVKTMKREFSGTYANQYMIVDFKRFKPKQPLQSGLLFVAEEMPGLIVSGDVTDVLAKGYWPSYNVPYWPAIYEKSGYPKMVAKLGNSFSYDLAPRATIFRRDQSGVKDMETLKKLMRKNNFKHDSLSEKNPGYAICSRLDLYTKNPRASGCYDTKVTSYLSGATRRKAEIINGPTQSKGEGDLSPFDWKEFPGTSHLGLPETYNFDFIPTQPRDWSHNAKERLSNSNILRAE